MSQPTAPRTGAAAESYARGRVGGKMPDSGLCLQFTRQNHGIPSKYYSAIDAWNGAKHKHTSRPPAGTIAPVFFATPSQYKHVATLCANGQVITTNLDKIECWSSIDAVASGFHGPFMGWTDDLNDYLAVSDGGSNGSSSGGSDVTKYEANSTTKKLKLPNGSWKSLPIDDAGDLSMLAGPGRFEALLQVAATGLPKGRELQVRFVVVDYKKGSPTKTASKYPITEILGSGGTTYGQALQFGSIGTPASGWSRRLRAWALVYDDDVTITYTGARAFLL